MSARPEGVAPTILTQYGARRKTDRAREALEQGSALLVELFEGHAWEVCPRRDDPSVIGYGSWQAYLDAEFGELREVLRGLMLGNPDARQRIVAALTVDAHAKRTELRDAFGVSLGTVQNDLERAGVIDLTQRRAAREAKRAAIVVDRPAPEPPPAMSKRDRAVQLVAEQGGRGLTALELAEVTGWTGGSATGTMTDVHRQRRVTRTEVYRRGYAAYVVTDRH
jgi:hypothetical protein